MNCTKCHDHKYDPIEQDDYYRMRAIFEPVHVRLDPWQGETDFEKNGLPRVFDLHLDKPTYRHVRGDEMNEDKTNPLPPGVPGVLEYAAFQPAAVNLPPTSSLPALLPFVLQDQLHAAEQSIASAGRALTVAKDAFAKLPPPAATEPRTESKSTVRDDFSAARPEWWQPLKGDWRYANGVLRQNETGAVRKTLQLKPVPPADFEATLGLTIRGGEKWKSVGIVFDMADGSDVMVYMSAVRGGSRIQVALTDHGKSSYPPGALTSREILQDVRYTLEVRVRGQLLNASINGEPVLAHLLTKPRKSGALGIAAFDADVEFHHFTLGPLAPDAPMRESATAALPSGADARSAVALAEKQLAAAQARPTMIRAVYAATQARHDKSLARAAAAAEADYKLAEAELNLATAQKNSKDKDAEKKIKAASDALAQAKKRTAAPGESFAFLPASLKAQEGPEENNNATVQTYPETEHRAAGSPSQSGSRTNGIPSPRACW